MILVPFLVMKHPTPLKTCLTGFVDVLANLSNLFGNNYCMDSIDYSEKNVTSSVTMLT